MSDTLQKLKARQEQLNAKIKLIEQKEKEKARKEETRKKILLGAMIMEGMANSSEYEAMIMKNVDKYLKTDRDRKLFGLAPLSK
ncbi:hypothetical protein E4J49_25120 [Vibrio parahaemolyticus]|nr:hypothetical protein [Vibrio parahaemolyticus]EGR0656292.1 hypothetical protein [Vibrio parahaemolyticus]EGR0703664.1 hypothetical protein [Vibrio parahaemolyticus]EGR0888864.1 hypothetical protein [Vibrio parahaemolyticus]EJG2240516.1 hypothetical protein [Vibrio parahaemolyticus]